MERAQRSLIHSPWRQREDTSLVSCSRTTGVFLHRRSPRTQVSSPGLVRTGRPPPRRARERDPGHASRLCGPAAGRTGRRFAPSPGQSGGTRCPRTRPRSRRNHACLPPSLPEGPPAATPRAAPAGGEADGVRVRGAARRFRVSAAGGGRGRPECGQAGPGAPCAPWPSRAGPRTPRLLGCQHTPARSQPPAWG